MKTLHFTITILLLFNSGLVWGQSSLDEIREYYYKYKANEKTYEIATLNREFDDVHQAFTFYHNADKLYYVIFEHSSEFQGFSKEYFFKDDELFFIYTAESGENYFEEPVRKCWQTDYRYYLIDEKPIQILFKEGQLEGSFNLDSLMATIPNKNIYPQDRANLGLELENGRALFEIFRGLSEYR
ncbi:hypothetical protein GCM10009122_35030 [Fulvivirga kasyanovii]|uniref:GLPGLI family protein n=1 Tax=Fulvivirga kasyanovii TaxID=396812 RepID=A0ABW9RKH2_9BACT|nr:hypothetical protein [Fulvivirga kasyanovii]MTI24587.1 hypothetical protein [Fulvivirga kasyanovii]